MAWSQQRDRRVVEDTIPHRVQPGERIQEQRLGFRCTSEDEVLFLVQAEAGRGTGDKVR